MKKTLLNLVPKLCLGTQFRKALLCPAGVPRATDNVSRSNIRPKQSFGVVRSQAELGNERKRRCAKFKAFTLVELILVLGLLLAVSVLAFPAITRLYARNRLRQAGQIAQSRLNAGRMNAIKNNLKYEFRFQPTGRGYELRPAAAKKVDGNVADHSRTAKTWKGELPDGVVFRNTSQHRSSESHNAIERNAKDVLFRGAEWSEPIHFFPDGTATNAEFEIVDESDSKFRIQVRALTGSVRGQFAGF